MTILLLHVFALSPAGHSPFSVCLSLSPADIALWRRRPILSLEGWREGVRTPDMQRGASCGPLWGAALSMLSSRAATISGNHLSRESALFPWAQVHASVTFPGVLQKEVERPVAYSCQYPGMEACTEFPSETLLYRNSLSKLSHPDARPTHLESPCSARSLIPGMLPPPPCHSTLWTQNCRNWLHVFCHQHVCVTPITMPPSLPVCPLPWSQSLSLPLPSVYWLLAPSLTWRIQKRTFGYAFWAPESHNWRTGRNLVALIVKASSNVDCFSPPLISFWLCKCHLGFFKSFLNQCLLFEKYSNLLHCWLLRELTLCPLFHCASLFTNAPRAVFLTDEGVGKVALKQIKIKQKKDSIKAAWDGNVHIPSIQIIFIYMIREAIYREI